MRNILYGLLVAVVLATGVMAVTDQPSWGTAGWYPCNVNGNYGGQASNCWVAWDGVHQACTEDSRDATFTVGAEGRTTTSITIEHLDGVAETMDSFEIKDGETVLCSFTDVTSGTEVWKTLECAVSFSGVKTLTFHPVAETPWTDCATWGQVAVKNIYTLGTNDVPEFGTITALLALTGTVIGLVVLRKRQ